VPVICRQFGEHPLYPSREIWWLLSDHTPSQTDRERTVNGPWTDFKVQTGKIIFKKITQSNPIWSI
jgi:hypothetical protein